MSTLKKVVLITGSTDGIGKQTALVLAKQGFHVVIHGRSEEKCKLAIEDIKKTEKDEKLELDFVTGDLTQKNDIDSLVSSFKQKFSSLNVLINNAGYYAEDQEIQMVNFDGIHRLEKTFVINHLSHFYLTYLLWPLLEKSQPSRVITVSSIAHNNGNFAIDKYNKKKGYPAYSQSKLMNVLFSNKLADKINKVGNLNITSNSLHPGVVQTKLLDAMGFGGNNSLEEGAQTSIYLASSPDVATVNGKYFEHKKAVQPNSPALSIILQDEVWKLSEELLGIKFHIQKE